MNADLAIQMTAPMSRATPTEATLPLVARSVCYQVKGETLIDDLTVTLVGGPRTVVLGPNGAGKSLFLRLCHGLILPTSGSLTWAGIEQADTARRHQAMVFQKPVHLRRSAAANIDYALTRQGMARGARQRRVADALALAGLTPLADRSARVLSGGEQQRLALARAWATEPQVLFLDEPTASLDPTATRAVETLIAEIHRAGVKIVMTTHDLGQARRLADEILFMHRGRLLERQPADTFFEQPETDEAAAFIKGELLW
ncbi:MAG: ATP-binding cassette domain-containing protein [Pseudomonadota bacterium]